jgi:hypothetical protein
MAWRGDIGSQLLGLRSERCQQHEVITAREMVGTLLPDDDIVRVGLCDHLLFWLYGRNSFLGHGDSPRRTFGFGESVTWPDPTQRGGSRLRKARGTKQLYHALIRHHALSRRRANISGVSDPVGAQSRISGNAASKTHRTVRRRGIFSACSKKSAGQTTAINAPARLCLFEYEA